MRPKMTELEREMVPVATAQILAVRKERSLSIAAATGAVADAWFQDALTDGFDLDVAVKARRYVLRVGIEMKQAIARML